MVVPQVTIESGDSSLQKGKQPWLLLGFQVNILPFSISPATAGDPVLSHPRFLPRPQLVVRLVRQFLRFGHCSRGKLGNSLGILRISENAVNFGLTVKVEECLASPLMLSRFDESNR